MKGGQWGRGMGVGVRGGNGGRGDGLRGGRGEQEALGGDDLVSSPRNHNQESCYRWSSFVALCGICPSN